MENEIIKTVDPEPEECNCDICQIWGSCELMEENEDFDPQDI